MYLCKFVNFEEEEYVGYDEYDYDYCFGMFDVYFWLLLVNVCIIVVWMVEDLVQVDLVNVGCYWVNLKVFEECFGGFDGKFCECLGKFVGKFFFVFYEVFDYFEEVYGLCYIGVFVVFVEVQLGVCYVVVMCVQLKVVGLVCIFSELLF